MALTTWRRRSGAQVPVKQPRAGTLLGQLLLSDGAISFEQLREALCRQQETKQLLGEILVAMKVVTPLQLERALEEQTCLREAG